MTDDRFEALETKLAFQEDLIQKLDDALVDQQQQIMELQQLVRRLTDEIKSVQAQLPDEGPEPPPPHY